MLKRVTSHRTFTSYIDRTRHYYAAQGYEQPYQWARNDEVPFAKLSKPLSGSRLTLITTSGPWSVQDKEVLRGKREVWSGSTSEPPEKLFTDHLSWTRRTRTPRMLGASCQSLASGSTWSRGAWAASPRATTGFRPTTVSGRQERRMLPRSWSAVSRTVSISRCWFRSDPSATRP